MSMVLTEHFPKEKNFNLLLVLLVANGAAHSLFVIAFPLLGRVLGLTDMQTGTILTISSIMMMASAPYWGARSETSGRRNIITTGIAATGLFLVLVAGAVYLRQNLFITASMTFILIFGLRVSQAIAVGGVMPGAQAYIADSTIPANRAKGMGRMGAAFGIGTIAGGGIAMVLGHVAIVYGLIGLGVVLLLVWYWGASRLPESRDTTGSLPSPMFCLPYNRLWPLLLITFSGLLIYGALQQVIGLRLQDQFGFSTDKALRGTGAVMMASMAIMAVTQGWLIKFVSCSAERLLISGCMVLIIAMITATYATSYPVLLAGMVILGLGMGLIFPGNLALMSLSVDEHAQGRVAGVNSVSKGMGMALGPVTGAFLHKFSVTLPFYSFVYLGAFMLILGVWASRKAATEEATEEHQSA